MADGMRAGEAGEATFLVEHYWPGVTAPRFAAAVESVRTSVEELAREGRGVRYLHSTLVPEDETGFSLLQAESRALVEEAYVRAGVRFERIVDSLEMDSGTAAPGRSNGPA